MFVFSLFQYFYFTILTVLRILVHIELKKGGIFLVRIDKAINKPYYEQIILGIKEEILHGILQAGDQIPSVREMATQLLTNPNTVSKAYKVLEAQDVIITVRGKGTFVKAIEPEYRDSRQIAKIKDQLTDLVIEARYLNVPKAEIKEWISETYTKLGGHTNENNRTS